jgi:hypothetical protein
MERRARQCSRYLQPGRLALSVGWPHCAGLWKMNEAKFLVARWETCEDISTPHVEDSIHFQSISKLL